MSGIVSIITQAATTALTTVAVAKTELAIDDVFSDDAYVGNLINRASAIVCGCIGRTLGLQTVTETFRHRSGQFVYSPYPPGYGEAREMNRVRPLVLTGIPVTTVTAIVEDGTTLIAGTDYEIEPGSGLVWRLYGSARMHWAGMAIVVSYSAGYVLPMDSGTRTLPYDIEEVTLSLVRGGYATRGGDPRLIRDIVEGVGRQDFSLTATASGMDLDANSRMILESYRAKVW